ncbi:MAG: ABC transporter permease [Chthonomonadales bacterium]
MKDFVRRNLPLVGLILVIILFAVFLTTKQRLFLTPGTLSDMFKYYSPMALLALGMTFVILTGGIDLSVGFVMMLIMFVMAGFLRDHPGGSPIVAVLLGFLAAVGVGGTLGGLVAYAQIPAFIASLAVMVAAYGATMIISHNESINNLPASILWLGGADFPFLGDRFPVMTLFIIAAFVKAAIILGKTTFGRHLYAIGSNREAARLSGINVPRTEALAYVYCSICCWGAALMQMGINRTADPKVATSDSLELNAIAIVVIGGTSLAGGRGRVAGTALGALLLALVFYGLPLIGISEPSYKKLIQAGIILVGAILDAVQRKLSKVT